MRAYRAGSMLMAGSLAVVLVSCTGHVRAPLGSTPTNFVPWIAATPTPSPPETSAPPPPPGTKPCVAGQLRADAFSGGGAAAGTFYTSAIVRNLSRRACYVDRRTTVRFLNKKGRQVQAPARVGLEPATGVVLPPESEAGAGAARPYRARIRLGITDICPPVPSTAMEFVFAPGGSKLRVALPPGTGQEKPSPDCGLPGGRGGYFVDLVSTEPPQPDIGPGPLQARIIATEAAHAPERFRYFVRLSNPSTEPVPLVPCPQYMEGLKTGGAYEIYLLNCSSVTRVPAGGSVTYEMYLDISSDSEAGPDGRVLLVWNLFLGESGPGASAWIDLR